MISGRSIQFCYRMLLAFAIIPVSEAQVGPQTEDLKIAVIVVERLVTGSADYQLAEARFNREMAALTAALEEKQGALRVAQERVITEAPTLDDASRADLVQNAESLQVEVDRMTGDIQEQLNMLREELLAPIYDKADNAVLSYVEELGFDLVLDGSSPTLGLVFLDEATDITDAILERMATAATSDAPPTDPAAPN